MGPDYRMVKTSVYLPESLRDRLGEVAERRGISSAALIRHLLEAGVASWRPPPRGGFLPSERSERPGEEGVD